MAHPQRAKQSRNEMTFAKRDYCAPLMPRYAARNA